MKTGRQLAVIPSRKTVQELFDARAEFVSHGHGGIRSTKPNEKMRIYADPVPKQH